MKKPIGLLLSGAMMLLAQAANAAAIGEASATIHWDTLSVTVISGPVTTSLGVVVPPTFDYASVDTSAGSDAMLVPVGFGASALVSGAAVSGSSSIDPFDADGLEALPLGSPSGSLAAVSSISDSATGGEFVEIETNRTILVSAAGAGSVLFEVDYTLGTFLAATSAPVAQSIARVTLGTATFPDGSSFILSGSTVSLELLNVTGADADRSLDGTLSFVYDFADGEAIFLASNALTTLDNVMPAQVPVPLPAGIVLLLSAVPVLAARRRRHMS